MEAEPSPQPQTLGWRDLFHLVNLKDFVDMVAGELTLIASSARLAGEYLPKRPFGPVIFAAAIFMVLARLLLLGAVVMCFGSAILAITIVRGLAALRRRGGMQGSGA